IALILWLLQRLRHNHKSATTGQGSATTLVVASSSNNQTVHAPTIHAQTVSYGAQSPLTMPSAPTTMLPKTKYEKVLPNVQFIGAEPVSLRDDVFYGQGLAESESQPNAILMRFANEPQRDKSNLTARVKAVLIYRFNGKEVDVVGSWLNEGSEVIDVEPDSRRHKLIVGMVINGEFAAITGKNYVAHRRNWYLSDNVPLGGFEKGTVVVQLTDRSDVLYRAEFSVNLSPLSIAPKEETAARPAWPAEKGEYIATSSEAIPNFPCTLSGYRSEDNKDFWNKPFPVKGSIRVFEGRGWKGIPSFPCTMNGCSAGVFMIRWRSADSRTRIQSSLRFYNAVATGADEKVGIFGYMSGSNCEQPMFRFEDTDHIGANLVDVFYELKFWQAAP
ncbi:MAG: hypothetical protein WBA09_17080, partial [Candidatus Acidiferrum sp.]